MEHKKPHVRITNWELIGQGGMKMLTGRVYGHPRIHDGEFVLTTNVGAFDYDGTTGIAETMEVTYILCAEKEQYGTVSGSKAGDSSRVNN